MVADSITTIILVIITVTSAAVITDSDNLNCILRNDEGCWDWV